MKKFILLFTSCLFMLLNGCTASPSDTPELPDYTPVVSGFFEDLKAGEFKSALDTLSETPDLGIYTNTDLIPEDAKLFFSNLTYTINGTDENGLIDVTITTIDTDKEIASFSAENAKSLISKDVDAVQKAFRDKLQSNTLKTKQETIKIRLDEHNKIIFSPELEKLLLGNVLDLMRKFGK